MSGFDLTIAQSLRKYNIEPLKKYGQNFILDHSLCQKIVKASNIDNISNVLEVGPGPAGLTRAILECTPKSLTVIEHDNRFIPLLEEIKSYHPALNIILNDALKFDIKQVSSDKSKLTIISNLPYNIGTELLVRWIKQHCLIQSITVMLQKEVVDRLKAKPGNKMYGRLSVLSNILCDVRKCFDVKKTAFYPSPKVDSAVVQLIPKKLNLTNDIINNIEEITKYAFGQRRKILNSSLKKMNILHLLEQQKIDKNVRAENITPEQYLGLAVAMEGFQ